MKRYTAAEARARLSDALDHAEAGAAVVIERRACGSGLSATASRDTGIVD
jgi:hypothetical protein